MNKEERGTDCRSRLGRQYYRPGARRDLRAQTGLY